MDTVDLQDVAPGLLKDIYAEPHSSLEWEADTSVLSNHTCSYKEAPEPQPAPCAQVKLESVELCLRDDQLQDELEMKI